MLFFSIEIIFIRCIDQLSASSYKLRLGLEHCIKSAQMAKLICEVAIEIGFTIGTLCDLDKINELKAQSIVELFYWQIRQQILKFSNNTKLAEGQELEKNELENKMADHLDHCEGSDMNRFVNSSTIFQWLVFSLYFLLSK